MPTGSGGNTDTTTVARKHRGRLPGGLISFELQISELQIFRDASFCIASRLCCKTFALQESAGFKPRYRGELRYRGKLPGSGAPVASAGNRFGIIGETFDEFGDFT